MSRRRMIDPDIWDDPDFLELPLAVRYLFIAHFSLADDEGRGQSDARRWKKKIFSTDVAYIDENGEKQMLTVSMVEKMLERLGTKRRKKTPMVLMYESDDGEGVYALPRWKRHQSVPIPKASIYPPPPIEEMVVHQKRKRGRPGKLAVESQIELLRVMAKERNIDLELFMVKNGHNLETILSREVPLVVQKISDHKVKGPITPEEEFANQVILAKQKGEFKEVRRLLAFPPKDWAKVRNRILGSLGFEVGQNIGVDDLLQLIQSTEGE